MVRVIVDILRERARAAAVIASVLFVVAFCLGAWALLVYVVETLT